MSSRPKRLVAAIVAALALLWAGVASAAPAGTVVGLFGACRVEHGGASSAVRLGARVAVGDTIDVPAGGKLKLRMADGSIVSLAASSRLTITALRVSPAGQRENAELRLAQGLLRAVVTPVEQPARFEVKTAVGTAAVRSTDWFVSASRGAMQVGVLRGSVVLTSAATGEKVVIPARWGARLEAGHDPVPPRLWSRAEFAAVIARTNVP
ncbi:MAG TPA: FecR family protein [Stellaceae bacterium]|nr:FecR family protein [Stellaceae bacterium]